LKQQLGRSQLIIVPKRDLPEHFAIPRTSQSEITTPVRSVTTSEISSPPTYSEISSYGNRLEERPMSSRTVQQSTVQSSHDENAPSSRETYNDFTGKIDQKFLTFL